MPPLRTADALGPQHASVRWASGTTEFWMPGLPRGADHIDRSAGIPEEGSSRTKVIPLEAATPKC